MKNAKKNEKKIEMKEILQWGAIILVLVVFAVLMIMNGGGGHGHDH